MSVSATTGPQIVYGQRLPLGSAGPTNPDLGPSVYWGGTALMDPRLGYNVTRPGVLGWFGVTGIGVIDVAPAAKGTTNVAASQHMTANTALTLATASTGVTVLASALTVWPSGNAVPSGALVFDSNPGVVAFGTADPGTGYTKVSLYDPTKSIARAVSLTSANDLSAINFTVSGYDIYGYPMTQTLAGPNATTVNTTKAFKFVVSITPDTTDGTNNVSAGTSDIIGLPIRADNFSDLRIFMNSTAITASTGFTAAVTTSPATASTGDVRGTYALQTAADGTKRLHIFISPKVSNVGSSTGLFGVTQA